MKDQKPHALCVPFPAQGHINPMMKFALLLHHRAGFRITFVNTEYNHNRLLRSRGPPTVEGSLDFQFRTIPDGLPPSEDGATAATQDIPSLCLSTRDNCLRPLSQLIGELNRQSPLVSCVVTDAIMTFALRAAEEFGIPGVILRTASACSFMCNKHVNHLVEKNIVPLTDESCLTNGYLDTPIDWIPGMIPNLRLKDFPTFIRTTDHQNNMLNFIITETQRSSKASAIIMNTFDELEQDVLNVLSTMCPPIFTVGPLHLLVDGNNKSEWMSSSLWREEPECLKWLDSKPPSSVIYVNFGSIAVLNDRQLSEFAWGLAKSEKSFLWIVREDLARGKKEVFGPEYWEEISGRGFIAGWCRQEEVLRHVAVGGFLTHCGWNSVMESLCSGVPMVCWPFFADQQINCRYVCDEWRVGLEINNDVKREEVGSLVREVLGEEKGKMMKEKAMEWKNKAAESIHSNGSSYLNFDKLVTQVLTE